MEKITLFNRLLVLVSLFIFAGFSFLALAEDAMLKIDAKTGLYKDLSYDALSDKGLTWNERAQLVGGETIHYSDLTDRQRQEKQQQLDELLRAIKIRETRRWADLDLAKNVEGEILEWLNIQIEIVPTK